MKEKSVYYVSYKLIYRVKPQTTFKINRLVFGDELEDLKHALNIEDLKFEEVKSP